MDFFKEFHENLTDVIGIEKYELRLANDLCLEAVVGDAAEQRAGRWYASLDNDGSQSNKRVVRGGSRVSTTQNADDDDTPNEFRLLLRESAVGVAKQYVGLPTTNVAVAYVSVPSKSKNQFASVRRRRRRRRGIDDDDNGGNDDNGSDDGGNSNDDGRSNIEFLVLLDQGGYHILNDIDGRTQIAGDDDDADGNDSRNHRMLHDFETLHALLEYHCESYRSSWASALFAKLTAIGGGDGGGGGGDGLLLSIPINNQKGPKRISRELED